MTDGGSEPPQTPTDAVPAREGELADARRSARQVAEFRKPSTIGGLIYLAVLVSAIVGIVITASGVWRTGLTWFAISLLVGAAARLALPDADAGMLRVRHRYLDAGILVLLGVLILFLSWTIPDQPV